MNILYGVCGLGMGHASRVEVIAEHLKKQGHNVVIITFGQAYDFLKGKFKVIKVDGFNLIFENGTLKKGKTIYHALKNHSKNFIKLFWIRRFLKKFKPDLCISDMEPTTFHIASIYSLPIIAIDNNHALTNTDVRVPSGYKKDFLMAKYLVNLGIPSANYFIITDFAKNKIIRKNTVRVPIIVRNCVRKLKPKYNGKLLVYFSKIDERFLNILKGIKEDFLVYGYNINKKEGNVNFKTKEHFLDDLKDCKAIIGNAGFSLMSEAICLKKPYFAIPLENHFEQFTNAMNLKKAGFGDYGQKPSKKKIINFLNNLEEYKKNLKKYNPDYEHVFKVIDKVIKKFE